MQLQEHPQKAQRSRRGIGVPDVAFHGRHRHFAILIAQRLHGLAEGIELDGIANFGTFFVVPPFYGNCDDMWQTKMVILRGTEAP